MGTTYFHFGAKVVGGVCACLVFLVPPWLAAESCPCKQTTHILKLSATRQMELYSIYSYLDRGDCTSSPKVS